MMDYDQIKRYTEQDVIEVIPLAYMRGRTLNDAFIILDEAQNTTVAQMKMFLTRMGLGSKIVVSGDTTQVDLPPHTRSGLIDALHRLRRHQGLSPGDAAQRGHRAASTGAGDRPRLRGRGAKATALNARRDKRDMASGTSKTNTIRASGGTGTAPGAFERALLYCRRGDVLLRLGLCVLTILALWCVTLSWSVPLEYPA